MWLPHQQLNNFFNMSALKINLTKSLKLNKIKKKNHLTLIGEPSRPSPNPFVFMPGRVNGHYIIDHRSSDGRSITSPSEPRSRTPAITTILGRFLETTITTTIITTTTHRSRPTPNPKSSMLSPTRNPYPRGLSRIQATRSLR